MKFIPNEGMLLKDKGNDKIGVLTNVHDNVGEKCESTCLEPAPPDLLTTRIAHPTASAAAVAQGKKKEVVEEEEAEGAATVRIRGFVRD